jgi:hypothetical protein
MKPQHHQARPRLEFLESRQLLSNSSSAALFVPPMMADDGTAVSFGLTPTSVTEITIVSLPAVDTQAASLDFGRPGDSHAIETSMTAGRPLGNDDFAAVGHGDDFIYFTGFTAPQYSFGWSGSQGYDSANLTPPPDTQPLGDSSTPSDSSGKSLPSNNLGDDSFSGTTPSLAPTHGSFLGQGGPATPTYEAPVNNGPGYYGPIDTGSFVTKFVSDQAASTGGNVLTLSESSSFSTVSPVRTQFTPAKQANPVIPTADSTISSSVHSIVAAGSVTTTPGSDRLVPLGSLPPATERRLADSATASSPLTGLAGNPDDAPGLTGNTSTPTVPPRTGSEALPPASADKDGNATEAATPALESAPLPSPQGAGLLDGQLPLGLAGLESALQALTGAQATGRSTSNLLMRCLLIGSWALGAALAWAMVRRKSSLPEVGLCDTLNLGRSGPPEEELS